MLYAESFQIIKDLPENAKIRIELDIGDDWFTKQEALQIWEDLAPGEGFDVLNYKYELSPMFDARKSFYGKAVVSSSDTNNYTSYLFSYGTLVAMADTEEQEVELYENWDYSQTTIRHVKEFLKQQGFKAETKKQIMEDYL